MVSYNTKEDYDDSYWSTDDWGRPVGSKPIVIHYNRYSQRKHSRHRAKKLMDAIGICHGEKVLIIGCGFGWLVEEFNRIGVHALGTDTSPYIHAAKDTSEEPELREAIIAADLDPDSGRGAEALEKLLDGGIRTKATILNQDSLTEESRFIVGSSIGDIDYIITEDLLPALSDEEVSELCLALWEYNAKAVYHLMALKNVSVDQDPKFNWKTLEDWQPLVHGQMIIKSDTYEIY